jgi:MSHA biogenesis protein MshM
MYLAHLGLAEFPFSLTPDPAYAFGSRAQKQALDDLVVAHGLGEGFVKVVGEVGTGKTLLCRRLLSALPEGTVTAYLPNPALPPRALMLALAFELGIEVPARVTEFELRKRLESCLMGHVAAGRSVVVCIDEAQTIPLQSLERVRLLSNLETDKRKLMQVVLFGQPELDRRLAGRSARQLRQRIAFHVRLGTMDGAEVAAYLEHRMRVAGFAGARAFSPAAARAIAWASRGVPRLVNVIANKSLMLAYGRGLSRVGVDEAWLAARDTVDSRTPSLFAMPAWAGGGLLAAASALR